MPPRRPSPRRRTSRALWARRGSLDRHGDFVKNRSQVSQERKANYCGICKARSAPAAGSSIAPSRSMTARHQGIKWRLSAPHEASTTAGTLAIAAGLPRSRGGDLAVARHSARRRAARSSTSRPAVRYDVSGTSTTTAPTTSLALSGVKYHPASLGTSATLTVTVGHLDQVRQPARQGHRRSPRSRPVTASRSSGSSRRPRHRRPVLVATKVIDLGPPPPVHFYASGVADAAANCTVSVTLDNTHFRPTSIGTKGAQTVVPLATSTKVHRPLGPSPRVWLDSEGRPPQGHLDRACRNVVQLRPDRDACHRHEPWPPPLAGPGQLSVCHVIRMIPWHTGAFSPRADAVPAARRKFPRRRAIALAPAASSGTGRRAACRIGCQRAPEETRAGRAAPPGGEPPGGAGDLG